MDDLPKENVAISTYCKMAAEELSSSEVRIRLVLLGARSWMFMAATAEVCDANPQLFVSGELRALQPVFQIYGRRQVFSGPIVTLKVFEDNVLVREFLEEKGNGRVLVVDGGGSMRCAILGGNPVNKLRTTDGLV
ncbi:hypothetical protein HHK36_033428 [Tetracentron sinense]|uniref:4-hydroxy-4-methyl-2-oxoglutarate aldolase n=1 Tax=Tetracentron sinense TaxID=13715 RepID=A0A834Y6I4_TETSI|nr:hypothetical protein HHK36_033428 [Tetracentron sinense]